MHKYQRQGNASIVREETKQIQREDKYNKYGGCPLEEMLWLGQPERECPLSGLSRMTISRRCSRAIVSRLGP